MWGQDKLCKRFPQVQGIIPTRVGTSYEIACYFLLISGSSPRVWGQALLQLRLPATSRIIPTRVGTSLTIIVRFAPLTDHPHACGDKSHAICRIFSGEGSSPRVWGQDSSVHCICEAVRIIPTRVGTSVIFIAAYSHLQDHPHACGDKFL